MVNDKWIVDGDVSSCGIDYGCLHKGGLSSARFMTGALTGICCYELIWPCQTLGSQGIGGYDQCAIGIDGRGRVSLYFWQDENCCSDECQNNRNKYPREEQG
jgi:hypothetical protein